MTTQGDSNERNPQLDAGRELAHEPSLSADQADLQSYLDGELPAAERAAFEARLASDAVLRAELDGLLALRDLLAEAPAAFDAKDPGDLAFERVRRSIHDAIAPSAPSEVAPAKAPARARTAPASRSRRLFFGAVVSFAAAAAVFFVSFGLPSEDGSVAGKTGGAASRVAARLNGTEIVRVEFGKMSGTYWEQSEGEERVAVVWIDDTFPGEVGRP